MKVEPVTAAAVRVTEVLKSKLAEQVEPQLMPPLLLVIVPLPFPARTTVRVYVLIVKAAVTDVVSVMGTVQVPVPEQLPPLLQPAKVEPVEAEAVRVTDVLKMARQVEGQLMPTGVLVTVPLPESSGMVTVSR
jgi:hypothetical protein